MEPTTVIIPVKDEEDGLRFLLEDYKASPFEGNSFLEFIFVIDGRTSDNSKAIATEFSQHVIDQTATLYVEMFEQRTGLYHYLKMQKS